MGRPWRTDFGLNCEGINGLPRRPKIAVNRLLTETPSAAFELSGTAWPRGKINRRLFLGQIVASVFGLQARAGSDPVRDGFRIIEAREGALKFAPAKAFPPAIWGFDGAVPGPLLRFKKGEEVKIRLVNKLAQP